MSFLLHFSNTPCIHLPFKSMKSTHYPLIPIVPFSPKGVHTSSLVYFIFETFLGLYECLYGLILSLCMYPCVLLFTDSRSKIFKSADAGIDSFHGLTEKHVSFLGFTEQICTILGSRRGVHSRVLRRNLTNSRILG
jgi:hypothetical protein